MASDGASCGRDAAYNRDRVLAAAAAAVRREGTAVPMATVAADFLDQTIEHGPDLVLPLHGGPLPMDSDTVAIQTEVHRKLGSLLRRGQQDGTIRHDLRTADVVIFGALLAQQLPHVPNSNRTARRLVDLNLAGMAPATQPLRSRSARPHP
jgi:hypothetical protein